MDDGRLTDGKGRVVSFKNTVIIMTSNLGSEWIAEARDMKEEEVKAKIEETLRRTFRPEFFNRIDDVIVFHRLSREEIGEIVEIQLQALAHSVADRGIRLTWTEKARRLLAGRGYDPTYGARPLKRLIQKQVADGTRACVDIDVRRQHRHDNFVSVPSDLRELLGIDRRGRIHIPEDRRSNNCPNRRPH